MNLTSKPTPEKVNQIRSRRKDLIQFRFENERYNTHKSAYLAALKDADNDLGLSICVVAYILLIVLGVVAVVMGAKQWA